MNAAQLDIDGVPVHSGSHVILLPGEPTPSESWAAQELQSYLSKITGEALEIEQGEGSSSGKHLFRIGRVDPVFGVDYGKLGAEGIHIESRDGDVILAGGRRGCLYAVYEFLEKYLGVRWYAQDCVVLPETGAAIHVREARRVFVPPLMFRDVDYSYCHDDPAFYVPLKLNGIRNISEDPRYGGNVLYYAFGGRFFVHSFSKLLPAETYGESHPEYYALRDGRRLVGEQPCLTNPEVLRIVTENLRQAMRQAKETQPDVAIFSVSQNDNNNYCECPACTALAESEGGQSGVMLHFVNACADAVREEFPDKLIETFAYHYTRKPPLHVRPHENVAVRLCSIECCFAHTLAEDPFNQEFMRDLEGWSRITNRLNIWDYVFNCRHSILPFPNLRVLSENIRTFVRHGAINLYEQGNYFSRGAECAELRTYLLAKSLWDPEGTDWQSEMDGFLRAYYGAAAEPIRACLELVHDTVCNTPNLHITISANPSSYLTQPGLLEKCRGLLDEAQKRAASAPVIARRVALARLPFLYAELALSNGFYAFDGHALRPRVDASTKTVVEEYLSTVRSEKIRKYNESSSLSAEEFGLRFQKSDDAIEVLTLTNDRMLVYLLPSCGGRVWRAIDRKSGKELLHCNGDDESGFGMDPGHEGYEEFSTENFSDRDIVMPFAVVEADETHAVLRATCPSGNTLTRTIELLPGRSAFRVSTQLSSADPKPSQTFRVHPALDVPHFEALSLHWLAEDGWLKHSLVFGETDRPEVDMWLFKDKCPKGIWGIQNDIDGTAIVNTFEVEDVDFCYVNANREENRVNLEQWSRPVDATAAGGPVLRNTYELLPAKEAPWNR